MALNASGMSFLALNASGMQICGPSGHEGSNFGAAPEAFDHITLHAIDVGDTAVERGVALEDLGRLEVARERQVGDDPLGLVLQLTMNRLPQLLARQLADHRAFGVARLRNRIRQL